MWLGLLALLLAGFIGGQSPLFLKLAQREMPPLFITEIRFLIALVVLVPFFLSQKKQSISRQGVKELVVQSIFFSANVIIFSIAIQYTTAIMSQIIYSFTPIFVLLLSYYFLKEKITFEKVIGTTIAFIGIFFLFEQSVQNADLTTFGTPLGNILTLTATIAWSIYMVISKKVTNVYSPTTTSFFNFAMTAVILIFFLPIEYNINPVALENVSIIGATSVFVLGAISSALMFFLIQFGIKRTTAFTAAFYQYVGPFAGAATAIPILGEKPTTNLIIGGILVLFGVFFATTYQYVKKHF
ncbi:MAG: DMT family transporter [Candidatus Levybacteria bacterium]|nr:DMT family transporter [Candidatus Levybacteria bacterium]